MKRKHCLFFLAIMGLVFLGCQSSQEKQTKNTEKQIKLQSQLQTNQNQQVEQVRNWDFATGYALESETNPSAPVKLAKEFNLRSRAILGLPPQKEILAYQQMVKDLLSTNAALVARGQKELKKRDNTVDALQQENNVLSTQMEKLRAKIDTDYKAASVKADKWERLVGWVQRICWCLGGFVGVMVLINVLAFVPQFAPIMGPVARIANGLTGGVFGMIGSVIMGIFGEHATKAAGVVPVADHKALQTEKDDNENALGALLEKVQALKVANPDVYNSHVKPFIAALNGTPEGQKIVAVKQDWGIASAA